MFYGNNVIKQEIQEESFDFDSVSGSLICESVCMTEYHNRLTLFENSTDSEERAILESELMVLQEMSIKDIGKNIIKALMFLWERVKKLAKSIKDFVTRAKVKELKARAVKLEEEVKKLKKEKSDYKDYTEELEYQNNELEKARKGYRDTAKELARDARKAEDENKGLKEKIDKILEKAIDNKYIYFSASSYLDSNCERVFAHLNDQLSQYLLKLDSATKHNEEIETFDPAKSSVGKESYYIMKKEFLDQSKVLTRDSGGETWTKNLIEKDLEDNLESNKKYFSPIKDKGEEFFEYVSNKLDRIGNDSLSSLSVHLSRCIEKSTKIAKKYYEEAFKNISKDTEFKEVDLLTRKDNQSDRFYALQASYESFENITMCLRHNTTMLSGTCLVLGKCIGALSGVVNSCSVIFGMDKITNKVKE